MGKWSLPQRSSWTFHEKSRRRDGSVTVRSIAELDPFPGCKYVSGPSLKIHNPSWERKSSSFLPLSVVSLLPYKGLCPLKSPQKKIYI